MPAATRQRALEAAVELLGADGVRALSHARVDERAGLPPGSTSNWFRTRRALLGGVANWIAEQERADPQPAAMPAITGLDGLIEGLYAVVELQTGPYAARTRARYALFLELADDPELGEPLRRQRREFERWTERIVIAVGIADPVPATRALMAFGDGLILHRLTIDPALDMRPAIEREVRALAESCPAAPTQTTKHRHDRLSVVYHGDAAAMWSSGTGRHPASTKPTLAGRCCTCLGLPLRSNGLSPASSRMDGT